MSAPTPFFVSAEAAERSARDCGIDLSRCAGMLAALSGGADSVFMLYTLSQLSAKYGFRLEALHVEHGIRGEESLRDAEFCTRLCADLSVPLEVRHLDVPSECRRSGEGTEEAARRLRYAALEEHRAKKGLDFIAVAHNETDQAETVLHHLLRGSGARGLSGIRVLRGRIFRPLLAISADEIRRTLDESGISYVTDSTNAEQCYTRNYLRNSVFPMLARVTPDPAGAIARAATLLGRDLALLDRIADDFYADEKKRHHRPSLAALEAPILSRVLMRMFRESAAEMPGAVHIDAAVAQIKRQGTSKLSCPSGLVLKIGRDSVAISRESEPPLADAVLLRGITKLPERSCSILLFDSENEKEIDHSLIVYKKSNKAVVSSDKIVGKLYVREVRSGDKYRYGGMTRSVKKLFASRHLGDAERKRLPIVCDGEGILWIPGFGIREGADAGSHPNGAVTTLLYITDDKEGRFNA